MSLKPCLNLCSDIEDFPFDWSHKFQHCITRSLIITRATNVWIKFTPFTNEMWKKEFLKYSVLQRNICCKKYMLQYVMLV